MPLQLTRGTQHLITLTDGQLAEIPAENVRDLLSQIEEKHIHDRDLRRLLEHPRLALDLYLQEKDGDAGAERPLSPTAAADELTNAALMAEAELNIQTSHKGGTQARGRAS